MRLIMVLSAALAVTASAWAQPEVVSQSIGAGASRAEGSGRILSSWVAMGIMTPPTQSGGTILSSGQPAPLIGNTAPTVTVVDESFILAALLGQVSPAELSLHVRGEADPNGDSRLDAADLVTLVNSD